MLKSYKISRIMSYSVTTAIIVVLIFLCPNTLQQTLPPKAVNPERIKLLKDALSWVTFRKNGQLASDQDLEPFFGVLKDKYLKSKHYKTMTIAFTRGVLPKLTLKENDPCDPSYTLEYRDSLNNSVTDGQVRKFTWDSYDRREEASRQFCDYREGLVCNQKTSKCECPIGSKMEPVSQGSNVKICLVQENEICSLLDLDHDPSSDYGALKMRLPWMIFNLEKPLSCKMGTQCRFKSTNPLTPLCYGVNNGPWDMGQWNIGFGEECTLNLYGNTSQCIRHGDANYPFGGILGYTCFNFGPRSQPKSPNVGFCAQDVGSYGFAGQSTFSYATGPDWQVQMIGFVSPATTPLRGKQLLDYYSEYWRKLQNYLDTLNYESAMAPWEGNRCNIAKTEKLLELWKFFKSLEEIPPPGKDYIATEAELWAKLKEAESLTVDLDKKICRTFTAFDHTPSYHSGGRALRCVRNSTDAAGNDGRCEMIPENEDVTYPWAKYFLEYRTHVGNIYSELKFGDKNFRKDIFEPELECNPDLGPPPGSQGAAPSNDTDVLEGGYCPPDRGCYQDYSDYWELYDKNCQLKDSKRKVYRTCQNLDDGYGYGTCEGGQLDKIFQSELETLTSYTILNRGDACQYDFEEKLRQWIETNAGNKYLRLIELYKIKTGVGVKGLCDRTKLLECSKSGTCECVRGFQPREVKLEAGTTVLSDYCYKTSRLCHPEHDLRFIFEKSSQVEKNEINRHYAKKSNMHPYCKDANWCVFKVPESINDGPNTDRGCTTNNTGTTGYEGPEPVTTTTAKSTTSRGRRTTKGRDDSNLKCVGDKCGWQDAGVTRKEIHEIFKIIILIKLLTLCFKL